MSPSSGAVFHPYVVALKQSGHSRHPASADPVEDGPSESVTRTFGPATPMPIHLLPHESRTIRRRGLRRTAQASGRAAYVFLITKLPPRFGPLSAKSCPCACRRRRSGMTKYADTAPLAIQMQVHPVLVPMRNARARGASTTVAGDMLYLGGSRQSTFHVSVNHMNISVRQRHCRRHPKESPPMQPQVGA
jgi:hypothetical protein